MIRLRGGGAWSLSAVRRRSASVPATPSSRSALSSSWARRFASSAPGQLLDDSALHSPGIVPDLAFGVTLALLLVGLSTFLIFVM